MHKLIIGCGYLGQRVAALWRAHGHRVSATTRRPGTLPDTGIEPVVCDVLEPASLAGLPRADCVLYAVGFDRAGGASMRAVYVDGLANVLERLTGPGVAPGRFIYISSSSVYGQTGGIWVDEDSPTDPEEESGRIVLDAEKVLRKRMPDAVILRFAGIYGPGRLLRRKTLESGEPIVGDGEKWLNLIHVEDGARAVLAAEQRARAGAIYNICDGHPVQRRDFYARLARQLGAPSPCFVAPPPDMPAPPHEKANRRLSNERMRAELDVDLVYSDYRAGIG